jgi:hypothetical protein
MRGNLAGCWFLVVAIGMAAVGCGSASGVACAPVHGQVLLAGKPLAEAMIVFHPLDAPPTGAPKPLAYCDAEGRFALTTMQTGDGAPPGRYAVTVELRAARQIGEEMVRDGRNLLPPQYADPQRTPLKYDVAAGANELPAIQIN